MRKIFSILSGSFFLLFFSSDLYASSYPDYTLVGYWMMIIFIIVIENIAVIVLTYRKLFAKKIFFYGFNAATWFLFIFSIYLVTELTSHPDDFFLLALISLTSILIPILLPLIQYARHK